MRRDDFEEEDEEEEGIVIVHYMPHQHLHIKLYPTSFVPFGERGEYSSYC